MGFSHYSTIYDAVFILERIRILFTTPGPVRNHSGSTYAIIDTPSYPYLQTILLTPPTERRQRIQLLCTHTLGAVAHSPLLAPLRAHRDYLAGIAAYVPALGATPGNLLVFRGASGGTLTTLPGDLKTTSRAVLVKIGLYRCQHLVVAGPLLALLARKWEAYHLGFAAEDVRLFLVTTWPRWRCWLMMEVMRDAS